MSSRTWRAAEWTRECKGWLDSLRSLGWISVSVTLGFSCAANRSINLGFSVEGKWYTGRLEYVGGSVGWGDGIGEVIVPLDTIWGLRGDGEYNSVVCCLVSSLRRSDVGFGLSFSFSTGRAGSGGPGLLLASRGRAGSGGPGLLLVVVDSGRAKASSASAFVIRRDMSSCGFSATVDSKSNLPPFSWNRENWSKVGNLADSSSGAFGFDLVPSSAEKGSMDVMRIGDGLGLVELGCEGREGRPRRMGAISGIICVSCIGGEKVAPIFGVSLGVGGGSLGVT